MDFFYQDPYPILKDDTVYKKLTSDYVKVEKLGEREILVKELEKYELEDTYVDLYKLQIKKMLGNITKETNGKEFKTLVRNRTRRRERPNPLAWNRFWTESSRTDKTTMARVS